MKSLVPGSLPAAFGVGAVYKWSAHSAARNTTAKSSYSASSQSSAVYSRSKSTQRLAPYSRLEITRSHSATPVSKAPASTSNEVCPTLAPWSGPLWGTVSFYHRPENQQILNNWSYSEDGPDPQDLAVRKLGDIHLSPSDDGETLRYWLGPVFAWTPTPCLRGACTPAETWVLCASLGLTPIIPP
ncbi:hypothetical protein FRC09_016360 [Ceratobasidium sp. 395]|nr:hypothetical protein FRC09_016360 [Ceratobasidium sp. 395]